MNVTVILVALIIGFVAITVFSLMALLFVRRREKEREALREKDDATRNAKTIEDIDAAVNSAISEINKLGALVQKEIDEKYKSMLFLYDLAEGKQKEISDLADKKLATLTRSIEARTSKLLLASESAPARETQEAPSPPETKPEPPAQKKRPKFSNPKHKQIWEKRESGQSLPEIAKELGMGQGEVKLILDMTDRAS